MNNPVEKASFTQIVWPRIEGHTRKFQVFGVFKNVVLLPLHLVSFALDRLNIRTIKPEKGSAEAKTNDAARRVFKGSHTSNDESVISSALELEDLARSRAATVATPRSQKETERSEHRTSYSSDVEKERVDISAEKSRIEAAFNEMAIPGGQIFPSREAFEGGLRIINEELQDRKFGTPKSPSPERYELVRYAQTLIKKTLEGKKLKINYVASEADYKIQYDLENNKFFVIDRRLQNRS